MSQTIPLFQVDAFTSKPFLGNPAAVCLLQAEAESAWMQAVAAEMNLSETAFVRRLGRGYELRWFTPAIEVELCGHATLATAHILSQEGWIKPGETARFRTRSGMLTAVKETSRIVLDFPAAPARPASEPAGLFQALGIPPAELLFNGSDYLVHLEGDADLTRLQPDFRALKQIKARGVMVTTLSRQAEYDFISRFFGPAAGIDEDPVTGSAHCTLGPFWGERLGKTELRAYQASPRGGEMVVRLRDDRVELAGSAVTVLRGQLLA